jgi:L-ascorbate metabolism protein UlaG (beta-lactamase superfamily)
MIAMFISTSKRYIMMLDKLCAAEDSAVSFCWMGNAGWLISHDNHLIAIDLDFMSERLWHPAIDAAELAERLEYTLVTHSHGDHFNAPTIKMLIDNGPSRVILPKSCLAEAEQAGISESRIIFAIPGRTFEPAPWLSIEPTHALHGHIRCSIYMDANFDDCGYIINMGGKRFFHPGDSVLLHEHFGIASIDVLFVSPTEHNTHVDGSRTLIEAIDPDLVFAQHFGTYPVTDDNAFWTTGYERHLRRILTTDFRKRYHVPVPGEIYISQSSQPSRLDSKISLAFRSS